MFDFIRNLFDSNFMPHGHCYLWDPGILWLHVISDGFIALAYYSIPLLLVTFVRKRSDLAYGWMFTLFGIFIFACGTTHVMEIWSVWNGTYRLTGVVKMITAVASVATVVLLVPVVPKALALPSPRQLQKANEALEREVEERRRSEAALRESQERFRAAFDFAPIGKALVAPDGQWLEVNQSLCRIVGYPEEELLTKTFQDITHPEDLTTDLELLQQLLRHEIDQYQMEKRYFHKEGHLVWVLLSMAAVYDDQSEVKYVIAQIQDITEQKQDKEAVQRANTILEQRNRELQDFAYVASHDLQEPLRKIQAFSDLACKEYEVQLDETGQYYLERIQNAAQRMSRLITDLLEFSRISSRAQPFEPVDLNQIAATVMSDLEIRLNEVGGLITLDPLPVVEADPTQMHQLLQNLIGNALKFHREGVPPEVNIQARILQEQDEEMLELRIEDNGIGFEIQYLERIFAPFQRLHGRGVYEGTGMGLAICRRIIERHHGTITAESTPGEGTMFIIRLPLKQPT